MMMMMMMMIIIIIIIMFVRAPPEYIIGHNKAAGYMYWTICKHKWPWLLTVIMNIYLSHVSTVPLLCGTYRLSQIEHY
jgi:hypothetical protein